MKTTIIQQRCVVILGIKRVWIYISLGYKLTRNICYNPSKLKKKKRSGRIVFTSVAFDADSLRLLPNAGCHCSLNL